MSAKHYIQLVFSSFLKRNLWLGVLLFVLSFSALAQTDLPKDTFFVVKAYQPSLSDAIKIKSNPSIKDTGKINVNLDYGFLAKQVPVPFKITPITPVRIKGEPLVKLYNGYAKLGFGSNTTPLAQLYYNTKRSKKYAAGFWGKHLSSKGIALDNGDNWYDNSEFSDNELGIYGKRFLRKYTLSGDFNFNRNVVHYYGNSGNIPANIPVMDIKQRFNKFEASSSITKNYVDSSQLDYQATLKYHHINDLYETNENNFSAQGFINKPNKQDLYNLDFWTGYNQINNAVDSSGNFVLGLTPHITTTGNNWNLDVGIALFMQVKDETNFHFFPKARFEYNLIDDIIIPYVGIMGGLKQNTLATFYQENPFIDTELLNTRNSNTKYHFYAGVKGSLSKHLTFNTSFNKQKIDLMPLYVKHQKNSLDNQFLVIYDNVDVITLSGELAFQKQEKLKLIVAGKYNFYTPENELEAWHQPNYSIDISGVYDLNDKIVARLDLFAIGSQYARLTTIDSTATPVVSYAAESLKGVFDANLGLEYRYTKKLSIFLNFQNIGAMRYRRWQDYPSQRLNVIGGLTYSF